MLKKSLAAGIILLFISSGIIPVVISDNPISTKTIYVDDDNTDGPWDGTQEYPYQRIQDAIDNSSDGDIIFVYNGIYHENIIIDKSLCLMGEDKNSTIITKNRYDNIITIVDGSSVIHGFTVSGGSDSDACIYLESEYNVITSNIISHTHYGVYILDTNNNTIEGNMFSENKLGIWLFNSDFNTIFDNQFINDGGLNILNSCHNTVYNNSVNNKSLIYLEETKDIVVNDAGQIILVNCENITIQGQDLTNTGFAITLSHTNNSLIYNNKMYNNLVGTLLINSHNNSIMGNNIVSSREEAIGLQFSDNNSISYNNMENNWAGVVARSSYFNIINHNNFIENSIDGLLLYLYSDPLPFGNCWNGNYWDRPRVLPKPIFGVRFPLPWVNFDWHPAKEPYDIPSRVILIRKGG